MTGFTNYLGIEIVEHVIGRAAIYSVPSSTFLGLFSSTAPTDAGAGAGELADPGDADYARVEVDPTDWAATSATGSVTNTNAIDFPTAGGDWSQAQYAGLFDASTGGNLLAWGALTTNKTVLSGDIARFRAGNLTLDANAN